MPIIDLSPKERQALKAQAHGLRPTVLLGSAGLTDAVLGEIDRALTAHELIKVRVPGDDRAERETIFAEVAQRLSAAPVQAIGKMLVFYRPTPSEEQDMATKAGPKGQQRSEKAPSKGPRTSGAPAKAPGRSTPTRRDVKQVTPQPAPRRTANAARRAAGKGPKR